MRKKIRKKLDTEKSKKHVRGFTLQILLFFIHSIYERKRVNRTIYDTRISI